MEKFKFLHPTSILISGPTRCGKTTFVMDTLKYKLISPFPTRIIWLYKEWQDNYVQIQKAIPTIEFTHGLVEDVLDSIKAEENNLLVMDDLMNYATQSKRVCEIFTQESHHRNVTVILIIQNLFVRANQMRNISLNAHYLVLYKNPRDQNQVRYLAQQIFPDNPNFLRNVFSFVTKHPYSYLIIDLHPDTLEEFRVLTGIEPYKKLQYFQPV